MTFTRPRSLASLRMTFTRPRSLASLRATLRILVHPHEQHRARGVAQDGVGHAAEDQPSQATTAVGSHEDEADVERFGSLDDDLGGIALGVLAADLHALRAQPLL